MEENERSTIYDYLVLKETEELERIWLKNDRQEWRDIVFEIIEEIIIDRTGKKPTRDTYSNTVQDVSSEKMDENQPVFYSVKEVVKLDNWLSISTLILVLISVVINLYNVNSVYWLIKSWIDPTDSNLINFFVKIITFIITLADIGLSVLIFWLPIKALRKILFILMEIEFNSRKL